MSQSLFKVEDGLVNTIPYWERQSQECSFVPNKFKPKEEMIQLLAIFLIERGFH